MKVIDLLNKIANGEEVPKKIEYITTIYKYNNTTKNYYVENEKSFYQNSIYFQLFDNRRLNDEVIILKENK